MNNDHSLRGVTLADHIPGAMKTLVVSRVSKARTVAKKRAKYKVAFSNFPALC